MYHNQLLGVIELRNYLMKANARDPFIDYFGEHFISSQETLGGYPLGQFRIKGVDNRFFWIRGFRDMAARSAFLPAFYGGTVWKEFGPAANEMMLTWHDVHLLKPLDTVYAADFSKEYDFVVIDYYTAEEGKLPGLIQVMKELYVPFVHNRRAGEVSLWVSEMGTNDFHRLPVIQDVNMLVTITRYDNELDYPSLLAQLALEGQEINDSIQALIRKKDAVLLHPTTIHCTAE